MLVLLSFGLVLVATVLLVLGLLADDGLTLIYISIACSVLAGIVLVVATRMGKPKPSAAAPPAPLDETPEPEPEPATAVVEQAPATATPPPPEMVTELVPAPEAPVPAAEEEDFFPIADYDELGVDEVLPLLPELYADEIDLVEERERSGQGRQAILGRLAELREVLAGAPADTTASQVLGDQTPPAPVKKAAAAKEATKKAAPAKRAAAAKKAPAKKATTKKAASTTKKVLVEATDATAKKAAAKKTTAKKTTKKAAPPAER